MSNVEEVKKQLAKLEKEINDVALEQGFKQIEQATKRLYSSLKPQLETVVVRSDDKNSKPLIATVDTDLEFKRNNNELEINIVTDSKLERDTLIAANHGTGLNIRKDILNYIMTKTKATVSDEGGAKISKYYIDPTNGDTKFEKRLEKLLK